MYEITYALIVAVENYLQPKHFSKVRYAANDANDFAEILKRTGVLNENIITLVDSNATQTRIKKELESILKVVTENDRIIFFFTGHGAFENKENYIIPSDSYHNDIPDTSVSINYILGKLKNSLCQKNILFFDCCHSGFEAGDDTKGFDKRFLADQLIYDSRDEKYTVGFASCRSDQVSITDQRLKRSVWTHFLIEALTGEDAKIYESGLLFSDKLQTYLNKKTKEYVKINTLDKKDQVPVMFGNKTDRFIIADLNPLFEEKKRLKKMEFISLTNISLESIRTWPIKSLPGFKKGSHSVPSSVNNSTDKFVRNIGASIVENEISEIGIELREGLGYKLKEFNAYTDNGSGTINTPDFIYSVDLTQSDANPENYLLTKRLSQFKNPDIILNEEFNKLFSSHFDKLVFSVSKEINIEGLINKIEDLDDFEELGLGYDPSNLTYCNIEIGNSNFTVTEDSLCLNMNYTTSPRNLIMAYKELRAELSSIPELTLLS